MTKHYKGSIFVFGDRDFFLTIWTIWRIIKKRPEKGRRKKPVLLLCNRQITKVIKKQDYLRTLY
jgi:hypothetical protein